MVCTRCHSTAVTSKSWIPRRYEIRSFCWFKFWTAGLRHCLASLEPDSLRPSLSITFPSKGLTKRGAKMLTQLSVKVFRKSSIEIRANKRLTQTARCLGGRCYSAGFWFMPFTPLPLLSAPSLLLCRRSLPFISVRPIIYLVTSSSAPAALRMFSSDSGVPRPVY